MQIVEGLSQAHDTIGARDAVVTFGVFDGLHLGHQDLVRRVVERSRECDALAVVLTFTEHPLRLLAPVYEPPRLLAPERRAERLRALGVNLLVVVDFDQEFAAQTPEQFVERVLCDALRAKAVVLGFNNRFGRGGSGDTALLRTLGETHGFDVEIVPPREWKGSVVSSTRVRQLLLDGRVRKASALLGRNHVIEGKVVEGARRGRDLGFPTANLEVADALLVPSSGVYVVRVNSADVTHGGMMNIGHRPTFNGTDPTVEVHLFDFEGDLYGQMLRVELLERLRDEQRFSSVEDLVAQLTRDRADALATLARAT